MYKNREVMKTWVVIDSKRFFYDLEVVKGRKELIKGNYLVTTSHLDNHVCRVRVEAVTDDYVIVELVKGRPANIYWKLTKKDFLKGVYLINEELTAVEERGG